MSLIKRSWKWVTSTDTVLSWTDRVFRILGISAGMGVVSGSLAWIVQNFYAALVVGLVAWVAVLAGLLVQTTRQAESKIPLPTGSVSSEDVADHTAAPTGEPPQQPSTRGGSALHPILQDHELGQTYFENRTIYIADLAREIATPNWTNPVISRRTFDDCRIYGPAVLAPMNTGQIGGKPFDDGCKFMDGKDAAWVAGPETHHNFVGIVGLEDCTFLRCRFEQCGVLVPSHDYEALREETRNESLTETNG